jgi:S-formylglutathione hydrolase FrmB
VLLAVAIVGALGLAGGGVGLLTRGGGSGSSAVASTSTPAGSLTPKLNDHGTVTVVPVGVPGDPGLKNDVYVYRPPVADSAKLPVLYFLHGSPGHAKDVFDAGLPQLMDSFFAAGNPPFVLAAPDGNGAHHDDTEWANAVDGTDQMETFVTADVIKAVEGPNRRDRSRRAIAGFSMGGFGAANLGLRHPDLYEAIVPMAGYFHVDDPAGVFGNQLLAIVGNTPELNLTAARNHRVFIVDGDADNERVVKGESRVAATTMMADGVPVWFEVIPGSHSWDFVAAAFPDVERFLDGVWAGLRPPPPEIPASVRPPSTRGRWIGTVDGTSLEVTLPAPAKDPTVAKLESFRKRYRRPPVTYVRVVMQNPTSTGRPYTLAKVSFVDSKGSTLDANVPAFTLLEWARSSRGAKALTDVQPVLPQLLGTTIVPSGAHGAAIMVASGQISDVQSVFLGASFGSGTLLPAP